MKPLFVRCVDRTVFEIDRTTLDPKNTGCYDAYCFIDPRHDVEYISSYEWTGLCNKQWMYEHYRNRT